MLRDPQCQLCKLHKTCETVCIGADVIGPDKPDIMVIGEAPGAEEDANGKPFVGRSGKAIRGVLSDLGLLHRSAITNVVKCRPPNNGTPTLDQIRRCRVYLDNELESFAPRFVVLLGASAVKSFLGEAHPRMMEVRGRKNWVDPISGANIIATYHPAAALRDPKKWYDIVDDLRRIDSREFYDPQTVDVRVVGTVARLPKSLAFDLETMGLRPWDDWREILCVSWSSKKDKAQVTRNVGSFVEELGKDPHRLLVGHNLKFDLMWLRAKTGYVHQGPVFDTMVALHLLNENTPSKGLKWAAHQYTGLGDYAKDVEAFFKFKGEHWSVEEDQINRTSESGRQAHVSRETMDIYCGWDASATWEIYEKLKRELKEEGLSQLMDMEMRVLLALHEMEWNGMEVDPTVAERMKRRYRNRKAALKRAICAAFEAADPLPEGFSLDSPSKLGSVLFNQLRLPVIGRTPTGAPQVNEAALSALSTDKQWGKTIQKILEYRQCGKMISTYLNNMLDLRDANNKVHPSYKLTGARTGRLSCTEPNLQNIPRDGKAPVKQVFIGGQGRSIIQADYSQIELRIGAMMTGDRRMLETIRQGVDIHDATSELLFGAGFTKEQRHIAKTINFSIFYGAGPNKIAATGGIEYRDAARLIRSWFAAYPHVQEWIKEQHHTLMERGWVEDLFGRRRRLPLDAVQDKGEYASMMRKAANMPVQGSAAQITKMALVAIQKFVPQCELVSSVHDSILVACPVKDEAKVEKAVRKQMEDATGLCRFFGYKLEIDVPTPVDMKVGPSWAVS